jgi:hypothetical protein
MCTRGWPSASQNVGISSLSFSKSHKGCRARMASIPFWRAKRYFSMRPWTAQYWSYTSWRDNRVLPCQRFRAPAVDTGTNAP